MQSAVIPESFAQDQKLFLKELVNSGFGNAIMLSADPTTASGELQPNEVGFNSTNGKIFVNIEGTTYLWATLTAV